MTEAKDDVAAGPRPCKMYPPSPGDAADDEKDADDDARPCRMYPPAPVDSTLLEVLSIEMDKVKAVDKPDGPRACVEVVS